MKSKIFLIFAGQQMKNKWNLRSVLKLSEFLFKKGVRLIII